ncbi:MULTISPECIES: O-antigen polymerase [Rahnella]|uniref:O-antigen polymerase n=1 Tax=Rahnella sp. (strain Y9602) TaxID=2703885 RepID=A0ABW6CAJ0_RAHSY|nr:O-antigen polymerase [Rahnella aceris]NIA89112.1 oligosaccharide repeat unit polymerase [Rahnella aceris]
MPEISYFILISLNLILFVLLLIRNKVGLFISQWVIFLVWFFVFPSYLQYVNNIFPWNNYPLHKEISFVNYITCLFSIFLFLGYSISYKKNSISDCNENNKFDLRIDAKTNVVAFLLMIPSMLFISIVGISSFFMGRSVISDLVYSDGFLPMLYALSKFCAFGILVVYLCFWVNRVQNVDKSFGKFSYCIFIICIVINLIINSPLSSPRFHFLSMAIAIAVVFNKMKSRLSLAVLFIASPIFLFILFPLVKHLGESSNNYNTYDLSDYVVKGLDFDSFQQLVNIVRFVSDTGYSWGVNFIAGISFFIPRSLWESKPTNLGMLAAEHQGYFYTNLSAPLVGELYYAGDMIFVILGALIIGVITGRADSFLSKAKVSYYYFIGLWLSSFSFIIFRGSFGAIAPPIMLGLCSSLLLLFINKLSRKS